MQLATRDWCHGHGARAATQGPTRRRACTRCDTPPPPLSESPVFSFFMGPRRLFSWSCSSRTLPGPRCGEQGSWLSPHPFFSSAYLRPCLIHRMNYAHTSQTSPSTWATQGNSSTQVSGSACVPTSNFLRPSGPDRPSEPCRWCDGPP